MLTTLLRPMPLACLVLGAPACVYAQDLPDNPAAPVSGATWSANAAIATQYVARGFRQTWGQPALQAGIDLVHPDGWTAGTWVSNVSSRYIEHGSFEWDLYGGYGGTAGPLGYSLTVLLYRYPGARVGATGPRYDYAELSAGLSHGWAYARFNRTVTRDFFGIADARGTTYLDLGANIPFGRVTLNLHAGEGRVAGAGNDAWNWRDVKLGLACGVAEGWSLAAAWTRAYGATDAYDRYTTGAADATGRVAYSNPAKGSFALSLTRTF